MGRGKGKVANVMGATDTRRSYDPEMIVPRAVCLVQPAATLMAAGAIRTVYLPWGVDYRGRLLIHASSLWGPMNRKVCNSKPYIYLLKELSYGRSRGLPLAALVGSAELTDCDVIAGDDDPVVSMDVGSYVFSNGKGWRRLYAWTFRAPRPARRGVPCEGLPGLFRVHREAAAAVEAVPTPGLPEIPPPDPPMTILGLGWHLMGK